MRKIITYGAHSKEYKLVRRPKNTLSLTVKPDLDIVLSCPERADEKEITDFLRRKWRWIDRQIAFFRKYKKKNYGRDYVSGESFYYLGRQYQLVVKRGAVDKVLLSRGKLDVEVSGVGDTSAQVRKIIGAWYVERARDVFENRFAEMCSVFDYKRELHLRVKPLKRKWGSFKSGTITLNPLLVQASTSAIDYVITHELCHVRYKRHNKNFWKLMDSMCPGWEKVKEKLELQFS